MNILHTVEFYHPNRGGAEEVVRQISERLAARGHAVTVATTRLPERTFKEFNGVRIEEFGISGNEAKGYAGDTAGYQKFLLEGRFDVMMNYAAQVWPTDLVFPIIERLPYAKVLAPCGFSALNDPRYQAYFSRLSDVMRQYEHLIFHSARYRDIEFAKSHNLSRFSIIPNGAGRDEFDRSHPGFRKIHGIPEDVSVLITVGNHTGLKGHRAAISAFAKAAIGKSVLVIVGGLREPQECLRDCRRRAWWVKLASGGRKRVLLVDPPREQVVAAMQAADLFVFASNVECSPLVLFEAMASRTAFITTACGNAEEIVEWGQGGLVARTTRDSNGLVHAEPSDLAQAIESLIRDQARRQKLAAAGHQAWREKFTWEEIALRYEAVYLKLQTGGNGI